MVVSKSAAFGGSRTRLEGDHQEVTRSCFKGTGAKAGVYFYIVPDPYDLQQLYADFSEPVGVLDLARSREIDPRCVYCGTVCHEDDSDWHVFLTDCRRILHFACQVRMIAGSLAHQQGRCSCYGGVDEDPPGLTLRQGALVALGYWIVVNDAN